MVTNLLTDGKQPYSQKKDWINEKISPQRETTETETNEIYDTDSNYNYPLSQAKVGSSVWIVGFTQKAKRSRLLGMGLIPGIKLEIVNQQPGGSVIVTHQDHDLGLSVEIASKILVANEPLSNKEEKIDPKPRSYLREMPVGTRVRILGYDESMVKHRGNLFCMGLTPKTLITVFQNAHQEETILIKVECFYVSLSREEADALIIETVDSK